MGACMTLSTCSPEAAEGTHVFDILGYSKHMGMGQDPGSYIQSGVFTVGGHNWAIRFYPDGYKSENRDYIAVFLELMSKSTKVRASCDLRLVDQCTGLRSSVIKTGPRIFKSNDSSRYAPGTAQFKRRSEIEGSAYLKDDRLMIECIVTVFKKPRVTKTTVAKSPPKIDRPPSDMAQHVGMLLEEKEGLDVSFIVGGETIEAHRLVLAMRSPVLKAELYGPMREARPGQCITVKDMQPSIFRALLHFIYTDSLPGRGDFKGEENIEMIRLLLVAADRYAMERLKMVCQSILCEHLNVDTVSTTLALADQYNCDKLKDACLEFIKISDDNTMDAIVASQGFKDLKVGKAELNPISAFRNNEKVSLVKNEMNSVIHTSVVRVKFLGFKSQVACTSTVSIAVAGTLVFGQFRLLKHTEKGYTPPDAVMRPQRLTDRYEVGATPVESSKSVNLQNNCYYYGA
ncbi:BTB/POZ and MATH domain-containing protein 1-like [Aegilops tauschii subsp. strangulata]|uniref:Speckle-type POZ protein-like protein n=1 Tax=Aegilops tauschii TaxID=37682 RepID=N1QPC3_AEGTA